MLRELSIHMYGYLKTLHLSTRPYGVDSFLSSGGLAHIQTLKYAPRLQWSLSFFGESFRAIKNQDTLAFWVSDTGYLNPEAMVYHYDFPLSQLVLARTFQPSEVWRMGLEASQSGIFSWVFIHASKNCEVTFLRKLQLAAQKSHCKVLSFNHEKSPHWFFKLYLEEGFPSLEVL